MDTTGQKAAVGTVAPSGSQDAANFEREWSQRQLSRQHSEQQDDVRRKHRAVLKAENIKFSVPLKKRGRTIGHKDILQGVSLEMKSGETLAVMGPSGAGKTTFLDTLTMEGSGGIRTGKVELNGQAMSQELFQKYCAYVPQNDGGWPFLTCRESLQFAADFQNIGSRAARIKQVDELLSTMGLEVCQNTFVGNEFVKGLSGGQKRRLSLAAAFLKSPSVVFLDEVTSGLDAAAAAGIARFLQELAQQRDVIIMCTIHQPSAKIFGGFDRLLLLSRGRVAYSGRVSQANEYFASIGHAIPQQENPADALLDTVNSDFTDREAVERVLDAWDRRVARQISAPVEVEELEAAASPSCGAQSISLFRRMLLVAIRDPLVYISRIVVFLGAHIFFALVYIRSRDRQQDQIFNRLWLIMWHIGVPSQMSLAACLGQNQEFVTVRREVKAGMYRLSSYFATQFLIQVPLLFILSTSCIGVSGYGLGNWNASAFFPVLLMHAIFLLAFESAAQLFAVANENPLLGLFNVINLWFAAFLFAGFLVPEDDVIWPLRIFAFISPIKWATKAIIYEEFAGTTFEGADLDPNDPRGFSCPGNPVECYGYTGKQVLNTVSQISWAHVTDESEYWQDAAVLLGIAGAFRLAYFVVAALKCRGAPEVKAAA